MSAPGSGCATMNTLRRRGTMSTTANRGRQLAIAIPVALALLVIAVLGARWLRGVEGVAGFIATYPGANPQPEGAPEQIAGWVGWQHFFNMFLMVLIIKTGWQIRTTTRPPAHWQAKKPGLLTGSRPQRISIHIWTHLTLDALWIINGLVFAVMIFATGHWMRIVPTSLDIFPNALSAGLQYLSLDFPTTSGWASYNALQVLAYFTTVFIAAPLAAISGLRLSPAWRSEWGVSKILPIEAARKIHFPIMVYFVAFILVHVTLVFTTGALRNLNTMYAARDDTSWVGLGIFAASLVVTIIGWVLLRPAFLAPLASPPGKLTR